MHAPLIRPLILGVFLLPFMVIGQQGDTGSVSGVEKGLMAAGQPVTANPVTGQGGVGQEGGRQEIRYSDPGNNFYSNVPINELNARAYRRFHRRFQAVIPGEFWYKSAECYQVSFTSDQQHQLAYYDLHGAFMYSLKYYEAKGAPQELADMVKRRYPEYKIDLVTEITDGQRIFYVVQIMNPAFIKILSVTDGRIEIMKEVNNAGSNIGPEQVNAR